MTGRAIVLVRRTGRRVHGRDGADVLLPATVVCGAELLRLSGEEAGAGGRAGHCRCKGGHREEQEEEDPTGYGQDFRGCSPGMPLGLSYPERWYRGNMSIPVVIRKEKWYQDQRELHQSAIVSPGVIHSPPRHLSYHEQLRLQEPQWVSVSSRTQCPLQQ